MPSSPEDLLAPLSGTVVVVAEVGAIVPAGRPLAVIESMKMEYVVALERPSRVAAVVVSVGQAVAAGEVLVQVVDAASTPSGPSAELAGALDRLEELRAREALLADDARPAAVAKRHALGLRTARENIADLLDPGSFVEYGRFAFAAQTQRRSVDELQAATPADGLIAGVGTVNSALFGAEQSACAALAYDYTVLAGTQGQRNHQKKDRLFELIERQRLPTVLFAEGGGGRPGDTDHPVVTGLNTEAFLRFARLSGKVPTIGIAAGRCFAGNAALLGCCDLVVACAGASIGMGGPAMIEGGSLGIVAADAVGPVEVHARAGSVDLVVADEAAAVAVTKQLLAFSQGALRQYEAADQGSLAEHLPSDRRRAYAVRPLVDHLFDLGSVVELRADFGRSVLTALARLEGRSVGVVASNPAHLAGAIDADAADKVARFLQLVEARGWPLVTLVDTPGFMVGPEAEATGLVRHASRLFVAGAALTVPILSVVTRRGYGLGAQALCGGSFTAPLMTMAWPQAELGGMGLEGAVRLGFRRELDAIADPVEREQAFEDLVAAAYRHGRALNVAAHLELDDVLDPASTRERLAALLRTAPRRTSSSAPRFVDPW